MSIQKMEFTKKFIHTGITLFPNPILWFGQCIYLDKFVYVELGTKTWKK